MSVFESLMFAVAFATLMFAVAFATLIVLILSDNQKQK